MLKMTEENPAEAEEPPSTNAPHNGDKSWLSRIVETVKGKPDTSLRETLEEYIEEEPKDSALDSVSTHEKALLANILNLRDLKVVDVMIPRADIVSIEVGTTQKELLELLAEKQHSRLPVYKETLDNVLGTIHIKDILAALAKGEKIKVKNLVREIPIVAPSMHALDLLLQMRESRKHMTLVVDEFGGIDGLVAIGDVIESIVGEIDDEYDPDDTPQLTENADGSVLADARVDIEEFEEKYGQILSDEEREESTTLGGLVFSLAGRIPTRGEVLKHDNGMVFEVLDASPRHINQIRIRNIPSS
ncbi:MAG: hemolysin C [Micavibrio sp.]|nr:MAG: hemolysin C [Micavibrio sp.]